MLLDHDSSKAFVRRFTSFLVSLVHRTKRSEFGTVELASFLKRFFAIHGVDSLAAEATDKTAIEQALAVEKYLTTSETKLELPPDLTLSWAALWRLTDPSEYLSTSSMLPTTAAFYGAPFLARSFMRQAKETTERLNRLISELFKHDLRTAELIWKESAECPAKNSKRRAELRKTLRVEISQCFRKHCAHRHFTHAHFYLSSFPAWWPLLPDYLETPLVTRHHTLHLLQEFFSEDKEDEVVWTIHEMDRRKIEECATAMPEYEQLEARFGEGLQCQLFSTIRQCTIAAQGGYARLPGDKEDVPGGVINELGTFPHPILANVARLEKTGSITALQHRNLIAQIASHFNF